MTFKKLTRSQIIGNIHDRTGIRRDVVIQVVGLFIDEIKDALARESVVEIRGLGTFEIHTRAARNNVRNPKTGERIYTEKHGVAFFRPGRELRERTWSLRHD